MKMFLKGIGLFLVFIPTQANILQKRSSIFQKGEIEIRIWDKNFTKPSYNNHNNNRSRKWNPPVTDSFSLIIKNNTDSIICFYEDWNSWGYHNISFEIKTNEKIYPIKKKNKVWNKNFPSYMILMPGDSMITGYSKDCFNYWNDFDCTSLQDIELGKIKAIYQIESGLHKVEYFTGPSRICINGKDDRSDIAVYQSFPTSKIFSKEYDVRISNYSIQSIK